MDIAIMQLGISRRKTARNEKTGPRRRSVVKGGKRIASMAVAALGACYQWGIETGRVSHNPTKTVNAFKINRRERYLSEKEVACFSEAIAEFERDDPRMEVMADAVRLLMLTGCRKSEILTLEWASVDWRKSCLRLPDSKTGTKVVPLADAAVALLKRRWEAGRPDMRGPTTRANVQSRSGGHRTCCRRWRAKATTCGLGHHWEKVTLR